MTWDHESISRGTKCFSPMNNGYPGGYPVGFLTWLQEMGWWGDRRLHVPCGMVKDEDSIRVDIKGDVNQTHSFDACDPLNYPESWSFNWIGIDPPYTEALAESLYGTQDYWGSIDQFVKGAIGKLAPGGLLITLSYAIPKRPEGCNLLASWGIYQAMSVAHMRCLNVWQKEGEVEAQGLDHWIE